MDTSSNVPKDEISSKKEEEAGGESSITQSVHTEPVQSRASDRLSSPPSSPPLSPPLPSSTRRESSSNDYYSSRPRYDRLGNPIPASKRRPSAMSSVYGSSSVALPGDLGPNDPRRPKSPAPATLPGDLGARDPRRPRSQTQSPAPGHRRHGSEGFESPVRGARLAEDPPRPGEEDSEGDADADNDNDSEDEEDKRGRQKIRPQPGKTTAGKATNVTRDDSADSEAAFASEQASKPDPTKGESAISFKVTPPTDGRKRVHPSTAFDYTPSGTPHVSDDESHSELRAAQKLSLAMSAMHSTPSAHRVIRQIIRGDFDHFQREAEAGRKRQRMYLVSTDLSPESEYALEWTVGTVLRDGDTLFGVYAAGEEGAGASEGGVEIGQGADSVKDTASIVSGLKANTVVPPTSQAPSPLSRVAGGNEVRSVSRGVYSAAEAERRKAVESISNLCIRLLRKTTLQVRVVVEVFHCKSPRHMITELIDYLSPTLVIIGSRGRSAVKGVLLGSFSNYLVTKSSVPVMVARKKLRKHTKTIRNKDGTLVPYTGTGRTGRFSNVIEAPKSKGLRVQGWDKVGID